MAIGEGFGRVTTSEAVAQRLRSEIQRGMLDPGTRLRQSDVAARFGVSTTPVREAFALLQSDGLVSIDPHRGAIVFRPSIADVSESCEIREALELLAVRLAMPNMTPEILDDLQAQVDEMATTSNNERWIELNARFHLTTYGPCGRPRLCSMIAKLREAGVAYVHVAVAGEPTHEEANAEHQAIVDACRVGDVRAASAAVRAHLRHTRKSVIEFIERESQL